MNDGHVFLKVQNIVRVLLPTVFKLVPKADVLKSYLSMHPNQPFVTSLCHGFYEGFLPYVITDTLPWPTIVDNLPCPLNNNAHIAFVCEQCNIEVNLGHCSHTFGPDLLLGMTTVPIGVVPQPHSTKLCLIIGPSMGEHSSSNLILICCLSTPKQSPPTGCSIDFHSKMWMSRDKRQGGWEASGWSGTWGGVGKRQMGEPGQEVGGWAG